MFATRSSGRSGSVNLGSRLSRGATPTGRSSDTIDHVNPAFIANLIVALHLAFVALVALGGFVVLRWPKFGLVHVPAAAWGAAIELAGWTCPLTPLEQAWRARAGAPAWEGDFVARYVLPVLYPEGLSREAQVALGLAVIAVNGVLYAVTLGRIRRRTSAGGSRRPR